MSPPLCGTCWLDPAVPEEITTHRVRRNASTSDSPGGRLPIAYPREGLSLAVSAGALTLGVLLLTTISAGLLLVMIGVGVLYVRIVEARERMTLIPIDSRTHQQLARLAMTCSFRLDLPKQDLYLMPQLEPNAYAKGFWGRHWIVLHTATVQMCSPSELAFVIGHEMGHIKRAHTTWLSLMASQHAPAIPIVAGALRIVFNSWLLRAEYAADRAGLIACRDLSAAISALLRIHYWEEVDVDSVLKRADELRTDPVTRIAELFGDHPYLANRIRRLRDFHAACLREGVL